MQEVIIYHSPLEADMYHSLSDPLFWKCMWIISIGAIIYVIINLIVSKINIKNKIKNIKTKLKEKLNKKSNYGR